MGVLTATKARVLTDKMIALNLLNSSVAASNVLCALSQAANNPDLKRMYKEFGQETHMAVEALQTYLADREWATPFSTPEEQLQMALEDADSVIAAKG